MLYCIGHSAQVASLPDDLPKALRTEIFCGLVVLDAEYGEERNYRETGGYSLIAQTPEDVIAAKAHIDYTHHPAEWATTIGKTGYASALFIINNDFSIMLYLPLTCLPEEIQKILEE